MDVADNLILQMFTVDKWQVSLQSPNMKREALMKCLDQLLQTDVSIGKLVTDASSSVFCTYVCYFAGILKGFLYFIVTKYPATFIRCSAQVQKIEESVKSKIYCFVHSIYICRLVN